jgi:hypothetical protein
MASSHVLVTPNAEIDREAEAIGKRVKALKGWKRHVAAWIGIL